MLHELHSAGQEACEVKVEGPARALDAFTDLDRVGEHVLDAIEPRD
jgi:hypothetical protein